MTNYAKGKIRTGVSRHTRFDPVYWAEMDLVEAEAPKVIVKTFKMDSDVSEMDAAEKVLQAFEAWMATPKGPSPEKQNDTK
jgi:hypothetical protein